MRNAVWITVSTENLRRTLCLFITHYALLITHSYSAQAQLPGVWIGVHTEWDTDATCPLPTYMRLSADSTYELGMVDGTAAPIRSTWSVTDDRVRPGRVRLDTIHYAPGLVRVEGDLLRIGQLYPMVFRRFTNVPLDSAATYRALAGRVWQSDSLTVALFADGRVSVANCRGERTAHFWRLTRFGASVFLVIRGSQHEREGSYKPLWQVVATLPKEFRAVGSYGRVVTTKTFRYVRQLTSADTCRPSGFQTCDNCFGRMWNNLTLGQSQAAYELKQLFQRQYVPTRQPGQTGLIHIQFVQNCADERSACELTGFDADYCPKQFDTRITDQLLRICRQLITPDQVTAYLAEETNDRSVRKQDIAVSLTFRLQNGELIDIL